jgi:hypothetical protein
VGVGPNLRAAPGDTVLVMDEGNGARQILGLDPGAIRAVVVGVVCGADSSRRREGWPRGPPPLAAGASPPGSGWEDAALRSSRLALRESQGRVGRVLRAQLRLLAGSRGGRGELPRVRSLARRPRKGSLPEVSPRPRRSPERSLHPGPGASWPSQQPGSPCRRLNPAAPNTPAGRVAGNSKKKLLSPFARRNGPGSRGVGRAALRRPAPEDDSRGAAPRPARDARSGSRRPAPRGGRGRSPPPRPSSG